ncbi:MAG: sugar phosphate isomerase/epimerase [Candidatus Hydrogenedentes bacterium]|nr:sugar phosphate isomerase/epimerase [Candidatus Hydrogenedentota bacterium]
MKRISIGSWAYAIGPYEDDPVPWDEVTAKLKGLNFDGVELGGFGIHPNPETHPTKEDRDKLLSDMEAVGLAFSGFVPNLWDENLIDTEDQTAYIDAFREGLQFASDLGIKGIRVDCVQPPTILDEMDEATARGRVVSTWQRCSDEAADKGCYVTWEFEPGFAFNKPSQILRILDEVNRDNFGVEFDTCHAEMVAGVGARQPGKKETLPGGCLELAQKLRGKINHIHLIDSDGTLHNDETSSHPPFGDGYLKFDEILPELAKNDLSHDWWTIDLCFWADAWAVTERCKKSLDELNAKYGD